LELAKAPSTLIPRIKFATKALRGRANEVLDSIEEADEAGDNIEEVSLF